MVAYAKRLVTINAQPHDFFDVKYSALQAIALAGRSFFV